MPELNASHSIPSLRFRMHSSVSPLSTVRLGADKTQYNAEGMLEQYDA
jgi:hypothetical protein